jgi:enterochelin esterase-like enzyme
MRHILVLSVLLTADSAFPAAPAAWKPPLTPKQIQAALQSSPLGQEAGSLARKIIQSFGRKNLDRFAVRPKIEGTTVVWASLKKTPISVVRTNGTVIGTLQPVGPEGLQVGAFEFPNFTRFRYDLKSAGRRVGGGEVKIENYPVPPESIARDGVPQGRLSRFDFRSQVFPGTVREIIVYVPVQYRSGEAVKLMVWQDGQRHGLTDRGLKTPIVFDNLIHAGDMPVTVGIFIEPGRAIGQKPGSKARNRGFEYDGLGDLYPKMLLDEVIPEVERRYLVKFSADPRDRAVGGGSSGGICAFKTAWERPDQFGRVLSWVGSFVDLRGGDVFPYLVRKTERKPIKVYLLAGENDLDNPFGHWPTANRKMAAALKYMGYDHKLEWTRCFHGSTAMAAHLPDALRWLWRK